jgi:hypothetical protein
MHSLKLDYNISHLMLLRLFQIMMDAREGKLKALAKVLFTAFSIRDNSDAFKQVLSCEM